MSGVGTATFTAVADASLRGLFTMRHSCHQKNVVRYKWYKDAFDQHALPFDFGQNAQGRQRSRSKKVADSSLPVDDTKHCPRLHGLTKRGGEVAMASD